MVKRALVLALLVACQGKQPAPPAPAAGSDAAPAVVVPEAPEVGSGSAAPTKPEEPEAPDPGKVIDQLGAIPAWQAVIDRYLYLARRGQQGIVYGRVGKLVLQPSTAPIEFVKGHTAPSEYLEERTEASGYVWLVDDSEGNGALGIRVLYDARLPPPLEGERVAVRGAWELDAKNRWYWKSAGVEKVPDSTRSDIADAQPTFPDHTIATGPLPAGARTISVAKDGDLVYFQITGPMPVTEGDGWQVADAFGAPAVALLSMPGERPAYGGQEMRGADEKWHLKRQKTYVVRIGKIRKRGNINTGGKPALITARTAPVELK